MKSFGALALACLSVTAFNAVAAPTLNLGDPAPLLQIDKWVKGGPVSGLETGKVYVVEFWATWCGPCRASIPHLSELARQFKNKATFIGVDVWEKDEDAVRKFVAKMGDKMDYNVATDTGDTFMANRWMKAAGQNGIPAAFIVNQEARIAWVGHPMAGLEQALDQVIAGKWTLDLARKRAAAETKLQAVYEEAMSGADEATLDKKLKELEVLDQEVGGITPGKKFNREELLGQLRFQSAMSAYQKAVLNDAAPAEIEKLEAAAKAAAPKDLDFARASAQVKSARGSGKAKALFKRYLDAVGPQGDKDNAAELAKQLSDLKLENSGLLNEFAWTILTDEKVKQRDLPLATKLAKAAMDAGDGKEPAVLDTYARALFDSGKLAEAVDYQKRAVAASDDDSEKSQLSDTLKKYEAAAEKAR